MYLLFSGFFSNIDGYRLLSRVPYAIVDYYYIYSSMYKRRRQWHPTPVLLPRKSHGRRSLVGCSPWGHEETDDSATSLSLFTFLHWRRKCQPTPVFLTGGSQGRESLVVCRLWGRAELDTTEATQQQQQQ